MCIICVHYQQEKLTLQEARRNFAEMRVDMEPEHVAEVDDMLWPVSDRLPAEEPVQLDFLHLLNFPQYEGYYDDDDIICSD